MVQGILMKLILKKDWDIPIRYNAQKGKGEGHFCGRTKEVDHLVNELKNKESGSILISGYRGVGKTSLVYKALSCIANKDTIIVLLNASQLEAESREGLNASYGKDFEINPKKIMENLIKRLYSTIKQFHYESLSDDLKLRINNLYRKAYASEYKNIETDFRSMELLNEITKESKKGMKINTNILINVISIIASLSLASLTLLLDVNQFLPIVVASIVPFIINISYQIISKETRINRINQNVKAKYLFDDSIGNLEFDLEQIHREIKSDEKKLIYIIDELDKFEKQDQVAQVIKFFKNFFTLSDAIFVFIGDEKLYHLGKDGAESSRAKEYTYFTSRYFLSRPQWNDIYHYFDEIIEKIEDVKRRIIMKLPISRKIWQGVYALNLKMIILILKLTFAIELLIILLIINQF